MAKTFLQALEKSKKERPGWGTYIHFCRVLSGGGFSRSEISVLFNKHMPKEEFDKEEKAQLIDYLFVISNEPQL